VAVLVELPVQGPTVLLREAVADDVPVIVELLAADQLGATATASPARTTCSSICVPSASSTPTRLTCYSLAQPAQM